MPTTDSWGFAELVDDWRRVVCVHFKQTTRQRDESSLRTQLMPTFGGSAVTNIRRQDVYSWYRAYAASHPAGARRALHTLSSILSHGVEIGATEVNACHGVRLLAAPARRERWLTANELRQLADAIDGYEATLPKRGYRGISGRQCGTIVRLLTLTGCRCSEISQLAWMEVDFERRALALADSKTGPRRVPIGDSAKQLLLHQRKRVPRSVPFVFPNPRDESKRRSKHISSWGAILARSGLTDLRIHDLRHTWASHAVMRGMPLPVLARILGHSSTRVTEIYAHVADDQAALAASANADALSRMMEGTP